MKYIITYTIILLISCQLKAQQNPTTISGKIKGDTSVISSQALTPPTSVADTEPDTKTIQFGAALNYAHGIGTNANISDGIGFAFKLGFNTIKKLELPLSLYAGLGFDYLYFGGKSSTLTNNASIAINSNAYGWYPYLDLDLFPDFPISVFGNVYYGWRFYYTRQNLHYYDMNNVKQTKTENIDGDVTSIYGWGAGLKVKLIEHLKLELRYQRNYGKVAKIINPESIVFDNTTGNLKSYQNSHTDTDFDMYFLGLVIGF
ncbi:MAG: hypothetical protein NTU43_02285 [Bacteroidetes bacterium]|nr:hypothetical protein [Bacteroidota bacterium]